MTDYWIRLQSRFWCARTRPSSHGTARSGTTRTTCARRCWQLVRSEHSQVVAWARKPAETKKGCRIGEPRAAILSLTLGAGIDGVHACEHPKGPLNRMADAVGGRLHRFRDTGPRRHEKDVLHRNQEAEGRPAAKQRSSARTARVGGLELRDGAGVSNFEIEFLTTQGVSESRLWNAKNDLISSCGCGQHGQLTLNDGLPTAGI